MVWIGALKSQPLRTKLVVTAVGTAIAVAGAFTYLSFRYWRQETVAVAEQQALLAAASVRSAVESAITAGEPTRARRALRELVVRASVTTARVYGPDRAIVVSSEPSEEGLRRTGVWIPPAREIPEHGTARVRPDGDAVDAYLPVTAGGASLIEVTFSLEPFKAAMDRGARLGLLLLIGSMAAVIVIVATMLEREVMVPIERVTDILAPEGTRGRSNELGRIEESVADLIRKEREAERKVAAHVEQLASQAGLAEVGGMAAEMAHEFKRPLASIRSAISLLEQEYELNDQAQSLLAAVDGQLSKLTETMQDLFALAKPVELEADRVDLADTVDSALAQLAGLTDTTHRRVERRYGPETPAVAGDRHRLEQAVLNVMLNAMEAMEEGGTLTISINGRNGGAVLEFDDTGPGIPAEEIDRIVLPFYSTKPSGTGLGLPLVSRVVSAHRGKLEIESEPGRGTTVRIILPEPPRVADLEGNEAWPAHAS